jgi:hypothetical protein
MSKKIALNIIVLFAFSSVLINSVYASDSLSSDSMNTSEWTTDGRNLNGTHYYPGKFPQDISQLTVRTYATSDYTGDPIIAEGFMYGVSLRNSLFKLNASNISQKIDQSPDLNLFPTPVPSFWNNWVYTGDEYGNVYQHNASNLSQYISNSDPYPQHYSSLIVYGGYVYFTDWWSTNGPIYQANASNISQIINTYGTDNCDSAPVIADGFIYYGCGNSIYQLNATNITRKIAQYTAGGSIDTGSSMAVAAGYLYFGTDDNKAYQLNSSNISINIANFTTGGDVDTAPAIAHGFAYIGSLDGFTYQLNATNISQQISNYSTGAVYNGLTVTDDYLLVGGSQLYQLNSSNISQKIANYSLSSVGTPTIANGIMYAAVSYNFYQFGTNAPLVTQDSPANTYVLAQASEEINFICLAFDYAGLTNISLYITNNQNSSFSLNQTSTVSGQTNSSNWTLNLAKGNYTWNCLVYDIEGNSDWASNRTLVQDVTPPVLNITYPANNTFSNNVNLTINYTVSDTGAGVGSCWYSNDTMSINTTLVNCANITGVTWNEGRHNVTIWANDTVGNINNRSVTFTIDITFPTISITTPTNNTNSASNGLDVNYTASDLNRASCWYSNDTMVVNATLSSCANITTVTWTEGYHNVTVWVNDSAGNRNSSSVSFYIDSMAPALNITYPANNTFSSNVNLTINYTVSDSGVGVSSCWYSNDTMTVNATLSNCANITEVVWNIGQHNITIWANDTFGNKNSSSVRFTIDNTTPAFNNLTNQTVTYGNAFSYQINATDSSGISCFTVNDTTNFNINCSGYLKNNTFLNMGLYLLSITVNDTANNTNSVLMSVNVTTRPLIGLTLISPAGNINVTQNTTFQVSVNVSCSNTDCGEINVSLDPATGTVYNFTTCGASGTSGPNQTQCNTNYTGTTLSGFVTINTAGYQEFIVPVTGTYLITAYGASGGTQPEYSASVSYGALISGNITLTAGTKLIIVIGQRGANGASSDNEAGSGGGTFVAYGNSYSVALPLIVAGGGGALEATSHQ